MAVRALAPSPVEVDLDVTVEGEAAYPSPVGIPPLALALVLIPVAIDLLTTVMPTLAQTMLLPGVAASCVAAALMLVLWLRVPGAIWLAAATIAAGISVALRLNGDELAALLSLLSIVALGVGGGFASAESGAAETDA